MSRKNPIPPLGDAYIRFVIPDTLSRWPFHEAQRTHVHLDKIRVSVRTSCICIIMQGGGE